MKRQISTFILLVCQFVLIPTHQVNAQQSSSSACTTDWDLSLIIRDKISRNRDTLSVAQSSAATDGIDAACNESEEPPLPPGGIFGVTMGLPDGATYSERDVRGTGETKTWTIKLAGRHPFYLYWNPEDLPDGVFRLTDTINGGYYNFDMTTATKAVIGNRAITELKIQRYPESECVEVPVTKGWNIVSLPVIPNDNRVASVFGSRRVRAYGYNNGYSASKLLDPGKGYWLSSSKTRSYTICGQPAGTSVALVEGWNLIGPHRDAMSIGDMTTSPSDLIESDFYTYASNAYSTTDSLRVGKAYWVESSGAGALTVTDAGKRSFFASAPFQEAPVDSSWATLRFETAEGFAQSLYLSPRSLTLEEKFDFELPPSSPGQNFEARFTTNLQVASTFTRQAILVNLEGVSSSTVVSLENLPGYALMLESTHPQSPVQLILEESTPVTIPAGHGTFTIQQVPRSVANEKAQPALAELNVLGNYPNPFSARTEIQFEVNEARHTRVTLFNVLGKEVEVLLDKVILPGKHQLQIEGSTLPAGLYFYRIDSGRSSIVRSMVRLQ